MVRFEKKIILDLISKSKNLTKSLSILDIGCGSGLMLNSLTEYGNVSGMDASDEAIVFSRKIFKGIVKKGSLPYKVPYTQDSFDLITALDVIEHIDDDIEALRSIRLLMKSNGSLIVTVPAYMFLWSEHDVLNEHKRRYTVKDLKEKFQLSGFEIEKITYFNTFLFIPIALIRGINFLLKRNSKTDVELPHPFVNFILKKIFSFE